MLDILSTAELTVSASIVVGFLSLAMAQTAGGRVTVLVALGVWFVLVLAIGATGALSPAGGGAPALGLTVVLPIAALVGAYFALPPIRDAMAATPLPALIAVHAIRLLGYTFIVLYAEGRLPAPFAPSAGWGDMFIGATALPLAWAFMRFGARVRPLVLLWNALGVADLVIALTLGPISAPGPLQVFVGPPDSSPMTTLPGSSFRAFWSRSCCSFTSSSSLGCSPRPKPPTLPLCGAARTARRSRPEMATPEPGPRCRKSIRGR